MPKSLADAKTKFTLLLTKPANPSAPTVAELEAGIQGECRILSSDFKFTADASDTVDEKELCVEGNAKALGASNHTIEFSPFRYFQAGKAVPDETADALFDAIKTRGTDMWGYARIGDKRGDEPWEAGEEIYMGSHFITDVPQQPSDRTGYVKVHVVGLPQETWDYITVAAE